MSHRSYVTGGSEVLPPPVDTANNLTNPGQQLFVSSNATTNNCKEPAPAAWTNHQEQPQEHPIDFRVGQTIKASQQDLINHVVHSMVDSMWSRAFEGPENGSSAKHHVLQDDKLSNRNSNTLLERIRDKRCNNNKSPPSGGASSPDGTKMAAKAEQNSDKENSTQDEQRTETSQGGGGVKDVFKFDDHTDSEESSKGSPTTMASLRRKSQRSCKGKRYQAMLSEGVLPGKDTRKPNGTARDDDEDMTDEQSSSSGEQNSLAANIRKCSILDPADQSSSKRAYSSSDDAKESEARKRLCSPKDAKKSSNSEVTINQKLLSFPNDNGKKRFKTGDFDLDEHLAALPKCNIDNLAEKKKQQRNKQNSGGSSGSSSGKARLSSPTDELLMSSPKNCALVQNNRPRDTESSDSQFLSSPTLGLDTLAEAALSERERIAKSGTHRPC